MMTQCELTIGAFAVGYMRAFAVVSPELPTVERTLQTTALHQTSRRQVGAVVAAVGVQGMSSTVFALKHRQVLACRRHTHSSRVFLFALLFAVFSPHTL